MSARFTIAAGTKIAFGKNKAVTVKF